MPDLIPKKGVSLAIMTTHFFELLKNKGIESHFRGIVKDGKVLPFKEVNESFNTIEVNLVRVFEPEIKEGEYNYTIYRGVDKNFLVPCEFIYRNSIPKESSFWKRYDKGDDCTQSGDVDGLHKRVCQCFPELQIGRPHAGSKIEGLEMSIKEIEPGQIQEANSPDGNSHYSQIPAIANKGDAR